MKEKSKFLKMFEALPPNEQEKVAQAAIQISEMIAKKGVKK